MTVLLLTLTCSAIAISFRADLRSRSARREASSLRDELASLHLEHDVLAAKVARPQPRNAREMIREATDLIAQVDTLNVVPPEAARPSLRLVITDTPELSA